VSRSTRGWRSSRTFPSCGPPTTASWDARPRGSVQHTPRAGTPPLKPSPLSTPPNQSHWRGGGHALGAGVAGKRSHGWRSAAGTRVQLWPGRPKQTSGDRAWAAPSCRGGQAKGRPALCRSQRSACWARQSCSSPVRPHVAEASGWAFALQAGWSPSSRAFQASEADRAAIRMSSPRIVDTKAWRPVTPCAHRASIR
jgi:hypothetical protein